MEPASNRTEWRRCNVCGEEWEWPADFTRYGNRSRRRLPDGRVRIVNAQSVCNACYLDRWGQRIECASPGCSHWKQTREKVLKRRWFCDACAEKRRLAPEPRLCACGRPARRKGGRYAAKCNPCEWARDKRNPRRIDETR